MGVIASLDEPDVSVEAGESVTCSVRLHNTGRTVDTFTLDVLGETAEWATVRPASVNVFPGDDAVAVLTFEPPRSADVPCGKKAFALRIMAQEDTDGSVIQEGSVEVGGYADLAAELVPRTARGARRARTKLAVDNFGNGPVTVQFTGKDESGDIDFAFKPVQTVIEGGTTQLIPVRIRMRKRFLTGQPKTLPVEISLTASDGTVLDTAGVVIQPPMLPRWLPRALTFAIAGVILLAVLVPTFLNDAPKSKATTGGLPDPSGGPQPPPAPGDTPAPGTPQQDPSPPPGGQNQPGPQGGSNDSGASGNGTGPEKPAPEKPAPEKPAPEKPAPEKPAPEKPAPEKPAPPKPPAPGPAEPTAENIRIEGTSIAGSSGFTTRRRTVQAGQTIKVAEVVLDNPQGSSGTLEIRKNDTKLVERDLSKLTHERVRFSAEVTFKAGDEIVVAVRCTSGTCKPSALFPAKVTAS
ncbi:hypothetical protein [Streptomyces sp. NBC_01264]|uniref:COG1470 family protein n=1 Tax=Streptomyces sp. NBC_01264 TaxID=2903804 RepID=UPI00225440A7|nr:hypothetical protein [Streptomyces sp. NBC_01264]MCX4781764.1 hypothetical protein [Streptomyces sp. NBC_01264]